MRRRLAAAALAATLLPALLTTSGPAASGATAPAPAARHLEGTLPDGGTWVADISARWNGTIVLFSHGFGALVAIDAPDPGVQRALLDRGYTLAGTSYDPDGPTWALESATRDQFAGLAAVERVLSESGRRPRLTLALGSSMGGLVSGQEAERARGRIDGAVSICGLMAGGIDLNNYQLDGEHALARLLLPGQDVQLVRYASPAEGQAAAAQLSAAATAAQATPRGRARVALGTALLNPPAPPTATRSGRSTGAPGSTCTRTWPTSPAAPGSGPTGTRSRSWPAAPRSPVASRSRTSPCTRSTTSSRRWSSSTATPSRSGPPGTLRCCGRPS